LYCTFLPWFYPFAKLAYANLKKKSIIYFACFQKYFASPSQSINNLDCKVGFYEVQLKRQQKTGVFFMERMQCDSCGYVYDSEKGDSKKGVPAGTAWKDVPADYTCPECGAGRDVFIVE